MIEPRGPGGEPWDAIVIGTGMGGATLGHALTRAGWKVLFCERGKANVPPTQGNRGRFPEEPLPRRRVARGKVDELSDSGRYIGEITDLHHLEPLPFVPFLGAGGGGSTALYGAALERFTPEDFSPRRHHRDVAGSSLPERWPITYADLEPFYELAEQLYRVRYTPATARDGADQDRIDGLPAISDAAQELFDLFAQQGLHPYRLPLACELVPGCRGCQGYLCDRNCKNDSARICLAPALTLGAALIDECEVVRLDARSGRVTAVVCRYHGRELRLSAGTIVLAAGALESPALLLRSTSPEWPSGLANGSGLVGRGLMRHYVDLYAVFPKARPSASGNPKELALRDFYLCADGKFGSVQSFGSMPPARVVVDSLQQDLRRKLGRLAGVAMAPAKPVLRYLVSRVFARSHVLATIAEDLPYAHNRVTTAAGDDERVRLTIGYRISDREARRIATFRARMRKVLKPYRYVLIKQAENNQRLAHACGTCRFGLDAQESVLDSMNKAHDLQNLYVVDASFFPSSGGTNPGLTVAANALRVAAHLVETIPTGRSSACAGPVP